MQIHCLHTISIVPYRSSISDCNAHRIRPRRPNNNEITLKYQTFSPSPAFMSSWSFDGDDSFCMKQKRRFEDVIHFKTVPASLPPHHIKMQLTTERHVRYYIDILYIPRIMSLCSGEPINLTPYTTYIYSSVYNRPTDTHTHAQATHIHWGKMSMLFGKSWTRTETRNHPQGQLVVQYHTQYHGNIYMHTYIIHTSYSQAHKHTYA